MTEIEKIAYAKSFIDKLAIGIDPTDGTLIPDSEVVLNPRLSKCFLYVINISGISTASVAKLTKGQNITTDVLCKICKALDCDFGDIMEYIKTNDNEVNNNEKQQIN